VIFYSIAFAACYKKQSPPSVNFIRRNTQPCLKKQGENTHEEKLGLLLWRLTRRNCNKRQVKHWACLQIPVWKKVSLKLKTVAMLCMFNRL